MSLHDTVDPDDTDERTPEQLLRLDDEEAMMWLDDDELERREKLKELYDGAEQTREEWQEQERVAVNTLIRADMGELTESFDMYGNQIEVLLNLDHEQRELIRDIETKYEGVDDIEELSEEEVERLESMLAEFFKLLFHSFNGQRLDTLSESEQYQLTKAIISEWGVRAAIYAMIEFIETIDEKDTETMDRVKNLQGGEGPT